MERRRGRTPAEVRERAVRLLSEQQETHASQWAAIEMFHRASAHFAQAEIDRRPAGLTPKVVLSLDGERVIVAVETPGIALARHVARFHGGDVVAAEGGEAKAVFELPLPAWRSGA